MASINNNLPAAEVIYDALPYIDATHEDYDEYAVHLMEQEMKRMAPRQVEPLPPLNYNKRSTLLQQEVMRVTANRQQGTATNFLRTGKDKGKEDEDAFSPQAPPTQDTVEAWQAAVRQAKIAYEKERIRHVMLEISKEGSTAAQQWRQLNAHLEQCKAAAQQAWQEQKATVDAINLQRQRHQQDVQGKELHVLTTHYANLVQKTHQLKQAVAQARQEVQQGAAALEN